MSTPEQNKLPPKIFDRSLVSSRLVAKANQTRDFITDLVCDDLAERLAPISRKFENALILGPDAQMLPKKGNSAGGEITFNRLSTLVSANLDAENLSLPRRDYNLIVSILDLQIINDVPGYLANIHAHLAADGLMIVAAIGGNSLSELRAAWLSADAEITGGAYARIAPFIDVRNAGSLLQRAGLALPVADIEHHVVRYKTPLSLMQELKALGASNPLADRPKTFVTKNLLAAACAQYETLASDPDGRIRATLEILWMSGWAPHESQQKPLAPGSAQVSLAEALKGSN